MDEVPVVSTIVPVRNDAADLPAAVGAITDQDVPLDRIVLAVGPSSDDSLAVANRLAETDERVIVVENPTGSTPAALNRAMAECHTPVVARVDARSFLPAGYLSMALETLEATGAGNVGAVQMPRGRSRTERAIAAAMRSRAGSGGAAYRDGGELQPVDTAWLGVFRRSALDDVGGYDERFIRNQDAELNWRLNQAGHQVWLDPRLVVEYRPRSSLFGLARQYFDYGTWRCRTVKQHRGSLKLRQLAAPLITLALPISAGVAMTVAPVAWLVPIGYLGAVTIAAAQAVERPTEWPTTTAALVTMHLSWGTGFLASLLWPWP